MDDFGGTSNLFAAVRVFREDDAVIVHWEDGEQGVFPHSWLKANAPEGRRFGNTGRPAGLLDERDECSLWSAYVEYDETLVVSWAGMREVSRFPLVELRGACAFGGK